MHPRPPQMATATPFRFEIIKSYPQRGPLRQYRAATATAFMCLRCLQPKTAKLVATINNESSQLLCNSCYGFLLSVWNIRAGEQEDAERDNALLHCLASAVTAAEVERGRALLLARQTLASSLSADSSTLLSTAEAVGAGLVSWRATDLDWSVATLPLCKAVEIEVVRRVAQPLKNATQGIDLAADASGKLKPMVNYCRYPDKHLMLGQITTFLEGVTAQEAARGPLAQAMRSIARTWPGSDWLFEANGLPAALKALRNNYRNRAAHTEILHKDQFDACSALVIGPQGVLWRLLASTRPS